MSKVYLLSLVLSLAACGSKQPQAAGPTTFSSGSGAGTTTGDAGTETPGTGSNAEDNPAAPGGNTKGDQTNTSP